VKVWLRYLAVSEIPGGGGYPRGAKATLEVELDDGEGLLAYIGTAEVEGGKAVAIQRAVESMFAKADVSDDQRAKLVDAVAGVAVEGVDLGPA
jgi:hypothetical protein